MGYYSYHNLSVYTKDRKPATDEVTDEVKDLIGEISGYGKTLFYDNAKWYDQDIDVSKTSEIYPDLYIVIDREGEETGDIGSTVYHKGKIVASWFLNYRMPTLEEMLTEHLLK